METIQPADLVCPQMWGHIFKITQLDECTWETSSWSCSWIGKHIAPELAQKIIKCFLNAKFVMKSTEASSVIMTNSRQCALKS